MYNIHRREFQDIFRRYMTVFSTFIQHRKMSRNSDAECYASGGPLSIYIFSDLYPDIYLCVWKAFFDVFHISFNDFVRRESPLSCSKK